MLLQLIDTALISKNLDEKFIVLFEQILNGDISELDEAIKYNITTHDNFWSLIGYSLFEKTAECGHINVVKLLLKYIDKPLLMALNVNFYPLFFACMMGHVDIVRLLLEHGFDAYVNQLGKTRNGIRYSCLNYACMNGSIAIVQLLIAYGADIHQTDEGRFSPLAYACVNNRLEIAKVLIDHGADVNAIFGDTLLSLTIKWVFQSDCDELIQLLLEYGADPNIAGSNGKTVFDYVTEGSEIAQLLINAQTEPILK